MTGIRLTPSSGCVFFDIEVRCPKDECAICSASGMEAREGGDGTAPSQGDDSPTGEAEDAQK